MMYGWKQAKNKMIDLYNCDCKIPNLHIPFIPFRWQCKNCLAIWEYQKHLQWIPDFDLEIPREYWSYGWIQIENAKRRNIFDTKYYLEKPDSF